MTKSNNSYLKSIAEQTGSEDTNGHHSNNYYLKRISENISGGGSSGSNTSTVEVLITYTDNTTETLNLVVSNSSQTS